MRRLFAFIFLLVACRLAAAPMPAELETALKTFLTEGTKGWAFTQKSSTNKDSREERYNPLGRNSLRWTLIQVNGRAPTESETNNYNQKKVSRSSIDTAPNIKDQIDTTTCEVISETPELGVYRFHLKAGGDDDKSAKFMNVTYTLHRATGTITQVELASIEPFSPVMLVKIQEARTILTYSLPEGERPTFLQNVTVRVRGSAMWFKSLDQDMNVAYSDYVYAGKK